jgi:hypothetical protein
MENLKQLADQNQLAVATGSCQYQREVMLLLLVSGMSGFQVTQRLGLYFSNDSNNSATDRADLHGVLCLHQHSRLDEDLSWLGFIAKARFRPGPYVHTPIFRPGSPCRGFLRAKISERPTTALC